MDKNINDKQELRHIFSQVVRLHFIRIHSLLEETGLYPGQPPLLFSLNRRNGQSQRELSQDLNVKASTMAVMIKRMEKTGLIRKEPDENDQRISRIFITEEGKEVCLKLKDIHSQIEEESFKNFTPEEKELLITLMMKLKGNLEEVCGKDKDMKFCKNRR